MAPQKKAFLDECLSEEEEQKEARLDCRFTLLKAKSVLSIGGLGPHGPFIGQVTLLPRRERERERGSWTNRRRRLRHQGHSGVEGGTAEGEKEGE